MLDTRVRTCCAADATEAEVEAEARRVKMLADKSKHNEVVVKTAEKQPRPQPQKQKRKRKQQSKQATEANETQLQMHRESESQRQNTELDVYDFPGDMPTDLQVKSSSSSVVLETDTVMQPESSALLTHGATPRQSKQFDRLRRLIENGDHELGQNDEAEVRLRRLESSSSIAHTWPLCALPACSRDGSLG